MRPAWAERFASINREVPFDDRCQAGIVLARAAAEMMVEHRRRPFDNPSLGRLFRAIAGEAFQSAQAFGHRQVACRRDLKVCGEWMYRYRHRQRRWPVEFWFRRHRNLPAAKRFLGKRWSAMSVPIEAYPKDAAALYEARDPRRDG
jgi:hypothetical protein